MILDTSVIISLSTSGMIKYLEKLPKVKWTIGTWVEKEALDKALREDKWKWEALNTIWAFKKKLIKINKNQKSKNLAYEFMNVANHLYFVRGEPIKIIHYGEAEVIALAKMLNTPYIGIDEKTTRLLIENPWNLKNLLESKLHVPIEVNAKNMDIINKEYSNFKLIRSADIMYYAFVKGTFDNWIKGFDEWVYGNPKDLLLEAILWKLKFSGCSITEEEINNYLKSYPKNF